MKAYIMAELLFGNARFDKSRRPGVVERNALVNLIGGRPEDPTVIENLRLGAEQAARVEEPSEAVSAVASVVACVALYFPQAFFAEESSGKLPLFLYSLEETTDKLDAPLHATVNRPATLAKEGALYQRWCWGVSVGILQACRWAHPQESPANKSAYTYTVYLRTVIIPFFLWMTSRRGVDPMQKPLDAYLSAVIQDFADKERDKFGHFVRELAEQKIRRDNENRLDFSGFGKQIAEELYNRFWFSRSQVEKEQMLIG